MPVRMLKPMFTALMCSLLLVAQASHADEPMAVIVSGTDSIKPMQLADIGLIYLRKKLYWPNGKPVHPANLPTQHPLRRQFSRQLLGGLPESQVEYWNEQYFHGISPPHVVGSSEGMLRYVAETSGAIGYVAACAVDKRVKVLFWLDADGRRSERPECADATPQ